MGIWTPGSTPGQTRCRWAATRYLQFTPLASSGSPRHCGAGRATAIIDDCSRRSRVVYFFPRCCRWTAELPGSYLPRCLKAVLHEDVGRAGWGKPPAQSGYLALELWASAGLRPRTLPLRHPRWLSGIDHHNAAVLPLAPPGRVYNIAIHGALSRFRQQCSPHAVRRTSRISIAQPWAHATEGQRRSRGMTSPVGVRWSLPSPSGWLAGLCLCRRRRWAPRLP